LAGFANHFGGLEMKVWIVMRSFETENEIPSQSGEVMLVFDNKEDAIEDLNWQLANPQIEGTYWVIERELLTREDY
jgi:murein endopeptidase